MLNFKPITDFLTSELKKGFQDKGHHMNGVFEKSIRNEAVITSNSITINGYYNDYGNYLNKGVSPNKIPYSPDKRTGAGTSKYITGLLNYVKYRMGITGKKGLGIAFAIARVQKKKGMSLRFSKRGSFFVDKFLKGMTAKLRPKIEEVMGKEMELIINKYR